MSFVVKFTKIIRYLLALLLFAQHVQCTIDNSSKSLDLDLFGSSHNHKEDFRIPKKSRPRPVGDRNYTMLISGGYRPNRMVLTKHIVSIRTSRATAYFGDNHFCVGVIISEELVLTAAHCVVDRRRIVTRAHRLLVVAGAPNRLLKTLTTVERKVLNVLPHSDYVRKVRHDIAILHLAQRLPDDNDNVKVIPLIDEILTPGITCQMVGWGQLFYRGPYTANAVQANLTVFSYEDCKKFYPHTFDETMICAGRETEWDVDACRGDSGGPLICKNSVAAIVSWSAHCGEKGKPTVFTSIYHHRHWINFAGSSNSLKAMHLFVLLLIILFIVICHIYVIGM